MWNLSVSNPVYTILNIISCIFDLMAILICFIFLCCISYRLIRMKYTQRQVSIDVSSILCINTLCIIIMKSFIQIINVTLPTLRKDFELGVELNLTFICRVRAYLLWSMIANLYWSYALLIFFRFCRVVYPNFIQLQRPILYLFVFIPIQATLVFISLLPALLILKSFQPAFQEIYCTVLTDPIYHLMYVTGINFYIPMSVIIILYICIIRKMQQLANIVRPYAERNRRDYAVIRRILLNIIILSIVTVPYMVAYIIDKFLIDLDRLIYRIQWLSSSISSILFTITLPFITTQLRDLLKSNHIIPMNEKK